MAKSIAQYVEEGVETPQTQQGLDVIAEDAANKAQQDELIARGKEEGAKPEGRASLDMKPMSSTKMPTRPGQQPVITMDAIKAAGFDNLRDYMNAKNGLVRRGEKPADKSYENKVKFDPASYSAFPLETSQRRTQYKQMGYAKGGKINLDACGVSTHTPSKKKHANW